MAKPEQDRWTVERWLRETPPDTHGYEVMDGELVVSAAAGFRHQLVALNVLELLLTWSRDHAGGQVLMAPFGVKLALDTVLEPDVLWLAPEQVPESDLKYLDGAPPLVVEVASPGTARRDATRKAELYQRYGVQELWLVDPVVPSVEIRTSREGKLVVHAAGSGDDVVRSALDPRLVVVPARLLSRSAKPRS